MIEWFDEFEFAKRTNVDNFSVSAGLVSGFVNSISPVLTSAIHQEVNDSCYIQKAFRWNGSCEGEVFLLDLVVKDTRPVNPIYFFYFYSIPKQDRPMWNLVKKLKYFFCEKNSISVSSISCIEHPIVALFRESDNLDLRTPSELVYGCEEKDELLEAASYLMLELGQVNLYFATKL